MRKAAFMSREATIDFARGGRSSKSLNKGIAFFNVAMQDIDKSVKLFDLRKMKTSEGRKELFDTAFKLAIGSVLPAMILFAINRDKDWFKEIPDWQKDTSWILGENLKIPKSLSFASRLTSTMTEEFLTWGMDNRPMETKRLLQPFKDAAPSVLPTLLVPAIESAVNYSIFFERPIVPTREQNLPNKMQFGNSTSDFAKIVGEKFDMSPRKIDHLISGYFGFLGKSVTQSYDRTLGSKEFAMSLDEMPMVRRFVFDPYKNPKTVQKYYEVRDEQEKLHAEFKQTGKKPEGYDQKVYKKIQANKKAIKKLSENERKIINNPKLSAEERKSKLRDLEKKRIQLCERALGKTH